MTDEPYSIILSDAEVLALLHLLNTNAIFGVDTGYPLDTIDPNSTLVLQTALHALRARRLIAQTGTGEMVVQRDLLSLIACCAFPHRACLVYHWGKGENTPAMLVGYCTEDAMAMHSQPLPALHEFATVMDAKMLVNHIVDFCSLHSSYLEAVPAHAVSAESFARVRAVAGDDRSRAVAIFQVEAGVDRELAEALVADLAGAHPTVLIRTQPFLATEQEQGKSLSILNGDLAIWTIAECETRGGQPAVEIQPTTEQMLRLRLQSMVTQHHEK